MDTQSELPEFSGLCRLFPLPNVVLFPHVILPLHIFEPRYRQMTEDALAGDQLVTIVQACPPDQANPWVEPVPIEDVACVGRIIQHERLPSGRFNMLLLGCKRVLLANEVHGPKLYRQAEATVLEDQESPDGPDDRREELLGLFLAVLQMSHRLDPDLSRLLHSGLPTGILSDIIAHALDLPASVKQSLLEETHVGRRMAALIGLLRDMGGSSPRSRHFPRPFSLN